VTGRDSWSVVGSESSLNATPLRDDGVLRQSIGATVAGSHEPDRSTRYATISIERPRGFILRYRRGRPAGASTRVAYPP
jgi:hypothetical protein